MSDRDVRFTARDPLVELQGDVTRWVLAGAPSTRADERLARAATELAAIASPAPVVRRIAQQCAAVLAAEDGSAATPLLHLAASCAQVRGARATARAPEGPLVPLAPRVRLGTPLPSEALAAIKGAIALGESPDGAMLARVARDGTIADLRLLPWIPRVPLWGLDDDVARVLLGALGEAGLSALERALLDAGPDGSPLHLRALSKLLGRDRALALVKRAWAQGAGALRVEALRQWSRLAPEEAAQIALGQSLRSRDRALVEAVCDALHAPSARDRALDALVEGLCAGAHVDLLCEHLIRLEHPGLEQALLARLAEVTREDSVHDGSLGLLRVLGRVGSERAAEALMRLWDTSGSTALRAAAGDALLPFAGSREDVHRALVARWASGDAVDRRVGQRALLADPARWFERMGGFFTAEALAREGGSQQASALLQGMLAAQGASVEDAREREDERTWDPRWVRVAIGLLDDPALWRDAVELLTRARASELLPWALERLCERGRAITLVEALGRLGDPRATGPIAALLSARGLTTDLGIAVCEALRALDEPSAATALRATVAALPERRRRGALAQACERTAAYLERARIEGTVL
jgi:hypothetical protein